MDEKQTLNRPLAGLGDEDEAKQIALARSNPDAFGELYDRHVQPIFRFLMSRLGNSEEARDLTSQTFLAAFEAFPRYRHDGHFPAWLFSIARSKLVDHIRKEGRLKRAQNMSLPVDTIDPLQHLVQSERLQMLRRLVHRLGDGEQELLSLRYVAGLSFADMAVLLGRNEEAVKKSLYRLLARLQSQMEAMNG